MSANQGKKRGRTAGPKPAGQPAKKKQKAKRAARNGRAQSTRGMGPIQRNDAGTILQHAAPQMTDVIEKDEYVGDVSGSNGTGNVVVTKYAINPGQAALFPLGSAEAKDWTCWKCVYCEPYLMHEVSEFATDGSTGKVILAVDYNAANDVPTTKQQVEDMHSASSMPCEDIGLKLIPGLLNRADPKYVRTGVKPAGTDIRLYDGGNLYVVAAGQAGNSKISELRVRYKFVMCLPTLLNPSGGLVDDETVAQFVTPGEAADATPQILVSGAQTTLLIPTAVANGLGAVNTAGSIVPPAGDYLVTVNVETTCGGELTSVVEAYLYKNAVALWRSVWGNTLAAASTNGGFSFLVQCNGTDALSLQVQVNTSDASAPDAWGSMILQLI